jgi:hypothetical protein
MYGQGLGVRKTSRAACDSSRMLAASLMRGLTFGVLLDQSFNCIVYCYLILVLRYEQSPEFSIAQRNLMVTKRLLKSSQTAWGIVEASRTTIVRIYNRS